MNYFKTFMLMAVMTVLFVFVGRLIGGNTGMIIAFAMALTMNFVSYWFSDKIVLSMYGAKQVSAQEEPELYSIVQELTQKADIPMPKVYIMEEDQPNAFATGRNPKNAAVAVTRGIMRLLNRNELSGVIGHELSHVKNRDILIGTIAATLAGAIMMLANFARFAAIFGGGRDDRDGNNPIVALFVAIFAGIAATMIQMWISRTREYSADEGGAKICGNPLYLASALKKLELGSQQIPMQANQATAHMFIIKPFSARGIAGLFSTHPPTGERIARLEEMTSLVKSF